MLAGSHRQSEGKLERRDPEEHTEQMDRQVLIRNCP